MLPARAERLTSKSHVGAARLQHGEDSEALLVCLPEIGQASNAPLCGHRGAERMIVANVKSDDGGMARPDGSNALLDRGEGSALKRERA